MRLTKDMIASFTPEEAERNIDQRTGLLAPLFDIEQQTETALAVLDDPASFRPLGQAARAAVQAQFGLDVAVPITLLFDAAVLS